MTTPTPTEPGEASSPTTMPTARNWLAPISFVLALVPLVAAVILSHPSQGLVDVVFVPFAALMLTAPPVAIGVLICAISAIVTGGLALGRAKRYPPRAALKGFAVAGLVLGIVGTLFMVGGVFALFSLALSD